MTELTEIAILAYRNARFRDAIELLLQVTDSDPLNWLARLYLAMSYEKSGRTSDAHRLFKRIAVECPDEVLKAKAENALPLVEAEMRRRFQQQPVAPARQEKLAANDDIAWLN